MYSAKFILFALIETIVNRTGVTRKIFDLRPRFSDWINFRKSGSLKNRVVAMSFSLFQNQNNLFSNAIRTRTKLSYYRSIADRIRIACRYYGSPFLRILQDLTEFLFAQKSLGFFKALGVCGKPPIREQFSKITCFQSVFQS